MRLRELSQDEIDAVSGGHRSASISVRTGDATGGAGGVGGDGGLNLLSGNSTSVGILTFGQRTSSGGSSANGGSANGGSANSGFAL